MTDYQPGDVVNGHVFTGAEWVPLRNVEPPPAAAVTYPERLPAPGQAWQIGNTQGGKVWTGSSWQSGTGAFYGDKRWQPTFDFVGMREQDATHAPRTCPRSSRLGCSAPHQHGCRHASACR